MPRSTWATPSMPATRGGVDQLGDLDAVPGAEAQAAEQLGARRRLTGQRLVEAPRDAARSRLSQGRATSSVTRPPWPGSTSPPTASGRLKGPLHEADLRVQQQRPEQAQHEAGPEVSRVGIERTRRSRRRATLSARHIASPFPRAGPCRRRMSSSCSTVAPCAAAISAVPSRDAASTTSISSTRPRSRSGADRVDDRADRARHLTRGQHHAMLAVLRSQQQLRAGSSAARKLRRARQSASARSRASPRERPPVGARRGGHLHLPAARIGIPPSSSARSRASSSRASPIGSPPTAR